MNRRRFIQSALAGLASLGLRPTRTQAASQSIPLFNCSVAGVQYYDGPRVISELRAGDRLQLRREPANPHDRHAVSVYSRSGRKLGYMPRYLNEIPAAQMDSGRNIFAVLSHVEPDAPPWDMLEMKVYLETG
jgi:hypothetical protein